MQTNYFYGCNTPEDLKKRYKELVLQFHPDRSGGCEETMKLINAEFQRISKYGNYTDNNTTEEQTNDFIMFADILNNIVNLPAINIEIIGKWLWVSGNTYPIKDTLKNNGFLFASAKKMWFYRAESDKVNTYGKTMDIDNIRAKYGTTSINNYKNNFLTK
jgi:hypothetical protein